MTFTRSMNQNDADIDQELPAVPLKAKNCPTSPNQAPALSNNTLKTLASSG
eukprot:CAMPEP_0114692234 /NCGR_PEP_ID=MMETSP0191-20121206/67722_1 /TAXON_ID=126664 /ORGANISM="Sorites sp." /LENGTH=50 /DNA_ID=CAMNT_0001984409 /DNA_START=127 /DNA_END=275 /DNA_ORIENTATION=-